MAITNLTKISEITIKDASISDTFHQKLLSGEIRVKDAEKLVNKHV